MKNKIQMKCDTIKLNLLFALTGNQTSHQSLHHDMLVLFGEETSFLDVGN